MSPTRLKLVPETGKSLARCLVQRETPQPSAAKRKAGRKNLRAQALMLASNYLARSYLVLSVTSSLANLIYSIINIIVGDLD